MPRDRARFIDADGDRKFTAARLYAHELVTRHSQVPARLLLALAGFDEAVAAQAAGLCATADLKLESAEFSRLLASAPDQVRRGFAAYLATGE